jgi:hypothetical protein
VARNEKHTRVLFPNDDLISLVNAARESESFPDRLVTVDLETLLAQPLVAAGMVAMMVGVENGFQCDLLCSTRRKTGSASDGSTMPHIGFWQMMR